MAFAEIISLGHVKKSLVCQAKKLGHFSISVTGRGGAGDQKEGRQAVGK